MMLDHHLQQRIALDVDGIAAVLVCIERYIKIKLKVLFGTNNVRDECALQSNLLSVYVARITSQYVDLVGIDFLEGQ